MNYAWIENHSRQSPVSLPCQALGVPQWLPRVQGSGCRTDRPRQRISNAALLVHMKAVHAQSKGEYSWPRVWKKLLAQGIRVSQGSSPATHEAARHQGEDQTLVQGHD
jgi:hypothetical protein